MKKILVIVLVISLVAIFAGTVSARDIDKGGKKPMRDLNGTDLLIDDSVPGFYQAAAVDTYNIVRYSFEVQNDMGWTQADNTVQDSIFFHVDDFALVVPSGGDYGYLHAIAGDQSMWCGVIAGNSAYMCSWVYAPGYGNNWNQHFESDVITLSSTVSLAYSAVVHNEGDGCDELYVDYLNSSGDWVTVRTYGGYHDTVDVVALTVAETGTSTRFRFHFVSDGAWSDQDGEGPMNTDGACILDDIIVIADGTPLDTEDFESPGSVVGDNSTTFWTGFDEPGYGIYGGMREGLMTPYPYPCYAGTEWEFFEGSIYPADPVLYPGLKKTPFCLNGSGTEAPCQNESIISPYICMTKFSTNNNNIQNSDIPAGDQSLFNGVLFNFQVYRDLPLDNLVFYSWDVRNIIAGCPGEWKNRSFVYYGEGRNYFFGCEDVSDLVTSPNDTLQVRLSVMDMCDSWNGIYGYCTIHTPSPWFDNVYIQRVKQRTDIQWSYRMRDLFQDNFPPAENVNGFIRADMAMDIDTNIVTVDPGDSIVVTVTSPASGGIADDPAGGPAVYIHVKVDYIGVGTKPALSGSNLADEGYMFHKGTFGGWDKFRGAQAIQGSYPAPDKYMFDLNDDLFTYGYMIEYYFSAVDNADATGYLPRNALVGGAFEWTCLPSDPYTPGILYVDDYDHTGSWDGTVQNYMETALKAVSATSWDRYDMNSPSSKVGNALASRVNFINLGFFYEKIIWDSGDLDIGTIGNSPPAGKTDDCTLLHCWADDEGLPYHNHKTGLLIMSYGIITDLTRNGSAIAAIFMGTNLGVMLVNPSYYSLTGGYWTGGVVSPLVKPVAGGIFNGLDNFYAFGGCPIMNALDVLEINDPSANYGLSYPDFPLINGAPNYAAISMDLTTMTAHPRRAVTTGFSMMAMRDANPYGAPVRNEFLKKVFEFFENGPNTVVTDADDPAAYITKLHGNYPNPFNPTTAIKFDMKVKGHVSIQIYDVAGRLVSTLVNGVCEAGPNKATWKGINNSGASVASGIYFYRMDTEDYSLTKKMVLLR